MKKLFAIIVFLIILACLGWAITKQTTPEPPPTNELATPQGTNSADTADTPEATSNQPAVTPQTEAAQTSRNETGLGSQHLSVTKSLTPASTPESLSDHTYRLQKEEKNSVEILPGVQVKSGTVQIEMDKDKDKWIEVERHPANSNSDYQIMLKKKF